MARLLEPQTILQNRYRVAGPIGQGGMGAVYRAEDTLLSGRICAIKEISPAPDLEPEVLRQIQVQFHQEASVLARLDHPNLPKVSDYFTINNREYLVMDYVPGYNLRELVEQARTENRFLDEDQVLDWILQLCDALSYLHSQTPPILHRDIKPSNIKLTPSGLIKLVDFGLVKLMTADDSQTITVVQGQGTAAYTPLEQYGGDDTHTDIRTDVYSLGATMYHLLTGRSPATARERFLQPGLLVLPRAINPHIAPNIEQSILSALSLHPNDRPSTVAIFKQGLTQGGLPTQISRVLLDQNGLRRAINANIPAIIAMGLLIVLAILLTP